VAITPPFPCRYSILIYWIGMIHVVNNIILMELAMSGFHF
jgi:hypothetical protein